MRIYEAIHTAILAHENQVRKLDQDIYVAHPLEVGMLLAKYGMSDEVICSGILHDTVEDTDMTLDDIEAKFGKIVKTYVGFCSETNKCLDWKTRKINYLSQIASAPLDVLFIVCVDKLTNIMSIYRNIDKMGDSIWDYFNAGYEEQKWYYSEILEILHPISYHPLYRQLNHYVSLVFYK